MDERKLKFYLEVEEDDDGWAFIIRDVDDEGCFGCFYLEYAPCFGNPESAKAVGEQIVKVLENLDW